MTGRAATQNLSKVYRNLLIGQSVTETNQHGLKIDGGIFVGQELVSPDPKHISTSYAERANLSIRMGTRRFTRLTNAFSKKAENHAYAVAIYFMHYNFVRIHQTLRCSPAMAAGVTTKLWELTDMVKVLEVQNSMQN